MPHDAATDQQRVRHEEFQVIRAVKQRQAFTQGAALADDRPLKDRSLERTVVQPRRVLLALQIRDAQVRVALTGGSLMCLAQRHWVGRAGQRLAVKVIGFQVAQRGQAVEPRVRQFIHQAFQAVFRVAAQVHELEVMRLQCLVIMVRDVERLSVYQNPTRHELRRAHVSDAQLMHSSADGIAQGAAGGSRKAFQGSGIHAVSSSKYK